MLIDSHCHLDLPALDPDRDQVMRRAMAAGVIQQVVPAITADTWPRVRDACAGTPHLHAAYGLHPVFVAEHRDDHLRLLRDWIEREHPVAVGECGLDHFIDGLDQEAQRHYFDGQLRLAREFGLPVIVHARRAVDAVIASIRACPGVRGVVHSWSGSDQQARQLWSLGFMLGLGGPVTYARATRLRELAARMPLEHLLLETDAPDQPDADIAGQRNEPARLRVIAETIADLRGISLEALATATTANAERLFALPHMPRPHQSSCHVAGASRRLSNSSIALPAATNAKAPVMCVAAPSPAPQSSLSAASAPSVGRRPETLPSACG
jgi:TatD DNase family protein